MPEPQRTELPPVIHVIGSSMEPTVPRGSAVRVVPVDRELAPGDVVVIRGNDTLTLHRVVGVDPRDQLVFHRGDAMGGIGMCRRADVLGRATALVVPMARLPELAPGKIRRAFLAARRRCSAYIFLRRFAVAAGIDDSAFRGRLSHLAARILLR